MNRYADIIDHPHHVSKEHPPLSPESRAAQFSPFAALTGYDDAVVEAARLTGRKIEFSTDEVERIDTVLQSLERGTAVTVEYFVPDERKNGGSYQKMTGTIRKIDPLEGILLFEDRRIIAFDDILHIEKTEMSE